MPRPIILNPFTGELRKFLRTQRSRECNFLDLDGGTLPSWLNSSSGTGSYSYYPGYYRVTTAASGGAVGITHTTRDYNIDSIGVIAFHVSGWKLGSDSGFTSAGMGITSAYTNGRGVEILQRSGGPGNFELRIAGATDVYVDLGADFARWGSGNGTIRKDITLIMNRLESWVAVLVDGDVVHVESDVTLTLGTAKPRIYITSAGTAVSHDILRFEVITWDY